MVEVLFQNGQGWFPRELTEEFARALEPFLADVEIRQGNTWRRAALIRMYLRGAGVEDSLTVMNVEGSGCCYSGWAELQNNWRSYHAETTPFGPGKEAWDQAIDAEPFDWKLRAVYADWLEENGLDWLMRGQRYQVAHQKTPGPACVQEAAWHEATWFTDRTVGTNWGMNRGAAVIRPEWCLPSPLFLKMRMYLLQRRDSGSHNIYAKSWNSRREAEIYLAWALSDLSAGGMGCSPV